MLWCYKTHPHSCSYTRLVCQYGATELLIAITVLRDRSVLVWPLHYFLSHCICYVYRHLQFCCVSLIEVCLLAKSIYSDDRLSRRIDNTSSFPFVKLLNDADTFLVFICIIMPMIIHISYNVINIPLSSQSAILLKNFDSLKYALKSCIRLACCNVFSHVVKLGIILIKVPAFL